MSAFQTYLVAKRLGGWQVVGEKKNGALIALGIPHKTKALAEGRADQYRNT